MISTGFGLSNSKVQNTNIEVPGYGIFLNFFFNIVIAAIANYAS